MIAPRSLFRCGFALERIPQLDDEIGARARSARVGHTLSFANIPEIFNKKLCVNRISKRPGELFGLTGTAGIEAEDMCTGTGTTLTQVR
jgi:hypothetical protein